MRGDAGRQKISEMMEIDYRDFEPHKAIVTPGTRWGYSPSKTILEVTATSTRDSSWDFTHNRCQAHYCRTI